MSEPLSAIAYGVLSGPVAGGDMSGKRTKEIPDRIGAEPLSAIALVCAVGAVFVVDVDSELLA